MINNDIWENITKGLQDGASYKSTDERLEKISIEYNIDIKNIVKDYLNFLIRNNPKLVSSEKFLNFVETIVHLVEPNTEYIKKYTIEALHVLLRCA